MNDKLNKSKIMNDELSMVNEKNNSQFTTHNSSLKKGYKQTEVSVIPEDWEVKCIEDVATIKGGGTPSSFNKSFWNGNINWFTPTEIGNMQIGIINARGCKVFYVNGNFQIL